MYKRFWISTKLLSAIVLIALIITGYPLLTLSGENPRGEWVLVKKRMKNEGSALDITQVVDNEMEKLKDYFTSNGRLT